MSVKKTIREVVLEELPQIPQDLRGGVLDFFIEKKIIRKVEAMS